VRVHPAFHLSNGRPIPALSYLPKIAIHFQPRPFRLNPSQPHIAVDRRRLPIRGPLNVAVLHRVQPAIPDVTLQVCGRVCEAVASPPDGVVLHGVVEDLQSYYRRATVVINPVMYGTGLKIKTVEALGYGKAVVSTPAGILGVGNSDDMPVRVADSPGDMAQPIIELLTFPEIRREWESKAHIFAQNNLTVERIMEPLVKLLNEREHI